MNQLQANKHLILNLIYEVLFDAFEFVKNRYKVVLHPKVNHETRNNSAKRWLLND